MNNFFLLFIIYFKLRNSFLFVKPFLLKFLKYIFGCRQSTLKQSFSSIKHFQSWIFIINLNDYWILLLFRIIVSLSLFRKNLLNHFSIFFIAISCTEILSYLMESKIFFLDFISNIWTLNHLFL